MMLHPFAPTTHVFERPKHVDDQRRVTPLQRTTPLRALDVELVSRLDTLHGRDQIGTTTT
jgi:hypothetical protein